MQPLVSVIVPVYKVEKYLVRCLDSLARQTLTNIEILLIDDASPDQCGNICEQYAAQDTRFKVFYHTENRGLSAARNTGISKATADYLMFVDSDDWVHEDFCKAAYECAIVYQADLVMFRYQKITDSQAPTETGCNNENQESSGYKTRLEAMDLLFNVVHAASWNKLYRKELFNTITYPEGYLNEDQGTTYKAIWKASLIYYLDKVLYYYNYCRPGSITALKTEKSAQDLIEMGLQQYHDLAAWGYPADKLDALLLSRALAYCIRKKPDQSDPRYAFCAKTLQTKKIPDSFSMKTKALIQLFKYCPSLFELFCVLGNKKYTD